MRRPLAFLVPILAVAATPVAAQSITYEVVTEQELVVDAVTGAVLEEGPVVQVSASRRDTPEDAAGDLPYEDGTGQRFVHASAPSSAPAAVPEGIAAYGPFRVLDEGRAALVDVTDETSVPAFTRMLRDHPGIMTLDLVEAPGTENDRANLKLGRMIHARGMATHVPAGGSVRSGGVELFLAGARRSADDGAEFAVHAWADEDGLEPGDYAANAPENRAYLDYYREMGMTPAEAGAFYAMTNSVPNSDARWLTAADMRQWVRLN